MAGRPFHLVELPGGVRVGEFAALRDLPHLAHAVTTPEAIDPQIVKNHRSRAAEEIARLLGLDGIAHAEQVHGNDVHCADSPGSVGRCDALITDTPALGVMAVSADCVLVLVAEEQGRCVGVAHASWRGTVAGVTGRMCEAMGEQFGVTGGQLVAATAPSAGPCCYQVGPEVREAAMESLGDGAKRFFVPDDADGRWRFDLWAANVAQLRSFGLPHDRVHLARVCTICSGSGFPSHRRQGESAGRFAAVVAPRVRG